MGEQRPLHRGERDNGGYQRDEHVAATGTQERKPLAGEARADRRDAEHRRGRAHRQGAVADGRLHRFTLAGMSGHSSPARPFGGS